MCSCRGTAGFAHVSCLAEQAKILFAEAEENNLDHKVKNERWHRWYTCSLCEQEYHGVCVRARVGVLEDVPEAAGCSDWPRRDKLCLGTVYLNAERHADALTVREAELAVMRRIGR